MLDFEYKLRTDSKYREKFFKLLNRFESINNEYKFNSGLADERKYVLGELLKLTEFNFSPFLSYYFPSYPKNLPFSLKNYPFAYMMYNVMPGMTLCVRASRQIAKSTNLCGRQIMLTQIFPAFKHTTITPHPDQIKTFANRLKEMIESYRFFHKTTNFRQNLFYREFPNKSSLKLTNCLTNVSKTRGISTDELDIDEAQDFDPNLETELMEMQSASDYPMTIYSGTSLTTDSFLEAKYQQGSRGVWVMKCPHCGHFNIPTEEGNVMKMIQAEGPSCVKCEKLLNVRLGKWVHEDNLALQAAMPSIHIPKIIVPANVESPAKWNRIYIQSKTASKNKFYQEVLGIPTEEGARELTTGNLINICILGDKSKVQTNARNKQYLYTVSGQDWGGSDHLVQQKIKLSYTAHVILGITNDYNFDIIHMRKYDGMDYDQTAGHILHKHREFNGFAAGSDFGVGQGYNQKMRDGMPPGRHWMFTYTGPKAPDLSEIKDSRYNHLGLNKTEAITRVFEAIKSRRIRCYNFDEAKDELLDCLNLVRAPHETPGGSSVLTYRRDANKSDDILHALVFAYHVGLLLINEPIFEDKNLMNMVNETLFDQSSLSPGLSGDDIGVDLIYG